MLISDSCKLLFVHIQKTGGAIIAKMLAKNMPDIRRLGAKHVCRIRQGEAGDGLERLS
jgi:hypothetical protein